MYTPPADQADEPEHTARYLEEPIAAMWRAFDRGRAVAEDFFADDPRRAHDPHLWAHLARYEAALTLREEDAASQTGEVSQHGWELLLPHHSGIQFVKEPFTVKVCKAVGDGPQSPGRNRARRQFFQQFNLSLFGGSDAANLILYWRVRAGDLELGLCKPRGVWRFKGHPKLEWQKLVIIDPLAGLTFPVADEDVDVFRLDDTELGEEETGV